MGKLDAIRDNPQFPWLSADQPIGVERFLRVRAWMELGEELLACEKAGDGNMNLTLRIRTDRRSLILKQARPWVEKYPHIEAPWDRLTFEHGFYRRVQGIPAVASRMPRLLCSDDAACAILLEDLAPATDLASLYAGGTIDTREIDDLADYLRSLHEATFQSPLSEFANRRMRALNHAHLFVVPLSPVEGLDLEKFELGLTAAAREVRSDAKLGRRISEWGAMYLSDGPCLVHGDFFPGSWMRSRRGIFVIDAEFCHAGWAEFDLGVAIAHFVLAKQPGSTCERFLREYGLNLRQWNVDQERLTAFVGIEILRRLIGVAQLPIPRTDGFRADRLRRAQSVVQERTLEPLWN